MRSLGHGYDPNTYSFSVEQWNSGMKTMCGENYVGKASEDIRIAHFILFLSNLLVSHCLTFRARI
jgi:hypothetical protein